MAKQWEVGSIIGLEDVLRWDEMVNPQQLQEAIASIIAGNVATADKWKTGRKITLTGDSSGNVTMDGSTDVTLTTNVRKGSTTQTGILQLTDGVGSTSNTTAATPAAVKAAYDKAVSVDNSLTGHKNDKNNPHKVTSAQVNVIAEPADASTAATAFMPVGLSTFQFGDGTSKGYPVMYGTVLNIYLSENRAIQIVFASYTGDISVHQRKYRLDSGWSSWEQGETTSGAQAKVDAHANRKDNPHAVTKAQVGLGNVDNAKQATKTEFDSHNGDNTRHITSTERNNWNAKETPSGAQAKVDAHANRKDNPHQVTSAQLNIIEEPVDASVAATVFPIGLSVFSVNVGGTKGYPVNYGVVLNINHSEFRCRQIMYEANTGNNTHMFQRAYRSDTGWSPWNQGETTEGAKAKADAAETNAKNASLPRNGGTITGDITVRKSVPKVIYRNENGDVIGTIRFNDDGIAVMSGTKEFYIRPNGDLNQDGQLYINTETVKHNNVDLVKLPELNTHKNDKGNPHSVTKVQVGLGNVDNVKQETPAGAQSKANAAENNAKNWVKALGLGGTTAPIITNLNDASTPGVYFSESTALNKPGLEACLTLVMRHNELVTQIAVEVADDGYYGTYVRIGVIGDSMGSWEKISTQNITVQEAAPNDPKNGDLWIW
ncbi:tail fiber protein [Bacillaceae bacterium Marseille-Q3522]|nr:tail fiber protein [Bacillaceae bacterium Marseille-Q3522]